MCVRLASHVQNINSHWPLHCFFESLWSNEQTLVKELETLQSGMSPCICVACGCLWRHISILEDNFLKFSGLSVSIAGLVLCCVVPIRWRGKHWRSWCCFLFCLVGKCLSYSKVDSCISKPSENNAVQSDMVHLWTLKIFITSWLLEQDINF